MTDVESRLTSALAARAALVPPPPALRTVQQPSRFGPVLIAAAAAAVVMIAVAASLLTGRVGGSSTAKAPAHLPAALVVTAAGDLALLDTGTGELRVVSPGGGRRVMTIAGVGDGKTFYVGRAVADTGCASTLSRVDVASGAAHETELLRSTGSVAELAVSPDHHTVAYVIDNQRRTGPKNHCDLSEMHLRDLRTGLDTHLVADATRPTGDDPEATVVGAMSWNANGSRLVFITQECCDGTATIRAVEPGRTLATDYLHTPVLADTEDLGCLPLSVVQRERDLLISAGGCGTGTQDFLLSWDEQRHRAARLAVLHSRLASMTYRSSVVVAMQLESVVRIDHSGELTRLSAGFEPGW
jgi:hypothetical protein